MSIYGLDWKYLSAHVIVEDYNWFEVTVSVNRAGVDLALGAFRVTLHLALTWR